MSPAVNWLLAAWQRALRIVVRVGRELAQWSATQSWWRLFIVAVLVLIAQAIINDHFFQVDDKVSHSKTRTHASKTDRKSSDHADEADIRIDENGITVRHVRKTDTPEVAPVPPATPGAPAAAGSPAPDASSAPDAGAAPSKDPAAPKTAPAAGDTPSGKGGLTIRADSGSDPDKDADSVVDRDADGDALVVDVTETKVRHWFGSALEGTVLLLIVYLIAAKIVVRQTAKSDARAAQAEQNAAAAAASAEREALQRQLAQAQLQTLQAQVEPHFLFNTLASVDYLIETDPARASAMQKNLIQYLRAALPQMRDKGSNLGREVDLSRAFLEILKVRMEERLTVEVDVPDGLRSAEFPPMMLQSLVENAIRHGVEPKAEGGEVRVSARVSDGCLEVEVADSGVGLSPGVPSANAGGGVGLGNIRERLTRLYGSEGSFSLEARQPVGAVATIRLPYRVSSREAPRPPQSGGEGPFQPSFKAE